MASQLDRLGANRMILALEFLRPVPAGGRADRGAGAVAVSGVQGVRVSVPRPGYHRWSVEDDERLRVGYRLGETAELIAVALNVTLFAVTNRAKKLGQGHWRMGRTLEQRFWDYVSCEPNSGCWLWEGACDRKGYGQLRIANRKGRLATHISLELRGRKIPSGMQACHRCDVPACVNPDHLFVGTPLENTADMISKGRVRLAPVRGSRVGGAVLTELDIPVIRARLARGETLRGIAASYGVTEAAISCVKLKKTWRHVE